MRTIQYLRNSLGMSSAAFAELLEVSKSAVLSWEAGRRHIPEIKGIRIEELYRVPREFLEEEMTESMKTVVDLALSEETDRMSEDEYHETVHTRKAIAVVTQIDKLVSNDPDMLQLFDEVLSFVRDEESKSKFLFVLSALQRSIKKPVKPGKMLAVGKSDYRSYHYNMKEDAGMIAAVNVLRLIFQSEVSSSDK